MTRKGGGDVALHHNSLRDVFAQFCHRARLGGQLEVGHGYGAENSLSRPADILVDLIVVSPFNSTTLNEARARSGSAAVKVEVRKHNANDAKCTELGWVCIVETYSSFSAGCPSGFAVAVQQFKGHCKHLSETEPHLSSQQCQSLAIPC